jgi:hypothetical protein
LDAKLANVTKKPAMKRPASSASASASAGARVGDDDQDDSHHETVNDDSDADEVVCRVSPKSLRRLPPLGTDLSDQRPK